MSGTSTGNYSYRDNANPEAFAMDNLRTRVYDVEAKVGELRAKKRIGFAIAALGIFGLVFDLAYGYSLKHADVPCKDAIVEAPTRGVGLSCPNANQRMDEHSIVIPQPLSDVSPPQSYVWAVRCICVR